MATTKDRLRRAADLGELMARRNPPKFDVQRAADRFAALYGTKARKIPKAEIAAIQAMPGGLPQYYAAINAGKRP